MQGKFLDGGELYIDDKRETYKALGFKKLSWLDLFPAVLGSKARAAANRAKELDLGGNMTTGDGFQNGGALIVEKGGTNTLLTYVQKDAPDHVSNEEVLKALGIQEENVPHAQKVSK